MGDEPLIFAVDLGGTHLRAALVDASGTIHHRLKQSTPQASQPEEIVNAIVSAFGECKANSATRKISSGSIAVPGTVNFEDGVVLTAPNLPGLTSVPLGAVLQKALGLPVIIENDANAAALGEMWRGAGRGYYAIVCVTLGTGVGGGIILDGKIWRGADGSAGEIGHIGVAPFSGVRCGCGSEGCLEVYASATAIVRMANEAVKGRTDSALNQQDITAKTVYQAGVEGDGLSIEVYKEMGKYLGIGLASIVNLLNPELIIIGGGVANAWDLFQESMHKQVRARSFPIPAQRVKIVQAQCGDNAGLLGAALIAFEASALLE